MTLEEALLFIQASLEAKTSQKLTATEEAILKAAWENDTYSNVAESLYLSVGHVKDLAYPLWQRLSDLFGIKVTKNNFRHILKDKSVTSVPDADEMMSSDQYDSLDSKGNILIVDDLVDNLHFLTDLLTKRGYKVRSVTNGNMAVRTIRNNPPDVILLDIKMPNMDGYQVCSLLKGDAETAEIPIIFLSALDEVIDKVKAFQAGGVDYITKPFETEEVIARIQTQLTIQQQKKKVSAQ
ncbi:response regulator receiver sensor signal transduction histidine kinase [Calothrix sp. NIES-4071]|nr:response regulator receiver sensor signal transduction histidine kinase [Calothrix sp. NIES-4071]BAZ58913.1 response regulator receiver sensor signal transduction histidine kinase [Calothrix sp. NIES-4105]